ncbi:M20 family metallopeptidase [Peribacillus alkalitolerans]|uniref:M20 family metallopeptidase n=1 Tax=Peribacillus alkalitolerans TaxID=1550385 RepID=UPI0013D5EE7F|nr:ArgE/DapE family deacylase [Peribacillus alkalitolerans]
MDSTWLTILQDLVQIDSSTKAGANTAIDLCATWLESRNLKVEILENNGYKMLLTTIGSSPNTIILNGHVDVVPGKVELFQPVIKENKLFGRGTADMKAGVVAFMWAVSELNNHSLSKKVQLQIVSDEETGGHHCSRYLAQNGYTGNIVICSEPTQLGIGLQAKGILRLDVIIRGSSAHSSRPWEGNNAIEQALGFHNELKNLPFSQESTDWYSSPSINLAKISGGDVYNKVPDTCTLSYDIRFLPGQKTENIMAQIQSILPNNGEMYKLTEAPPVTTSRENSWVSKLSSVISQYTNKETVFFGQHGAADTRFYSELGIPAVEFGPTGANWHGDEEYVEIQSIEIYKNMIVDFCKN